MNVFKQAASIVSGRRNIMTIILIIASLSILVGMKASSTLDPALEGAIASLVLFLVLPIMYCKIVLKEPLENIGLGSVRWLPAFFWGGMTIGLAGVLLMLVLNEPGFKEAYALPSLVERNFFWFIGYEIIIVGGITLCYEVFFRGLVMRLWLSPLGMSSILLQAAIFFGYVAISSGVSWQYAVYFYTSLFSGAVAYFSRSVYASWIVSWITFFLVDIVLLMLR